MVSMVMMPKGVRLIGSLRAPPKQKDSRLLVKEERRKGFLGFKEQHLEQYPKKSCSHPQVMVRSISD